MTDKPIIFSGPMVRALLDGRKTQTRRIIKVPVGSYIEDGRLWAMTDGCAHGDLKLPIATGNRLWVREAFLRGAPHEDGEMMEAESTYYRADGDPFDSWFDPVTDSYRDALPWRPSIHMPRWASRLTLIVTDVRVQRLQDISEADAMAEGGICEGYEMPCGEGHGDAYAFHHGQDLSDRENEEAFSSPVHSFKHLWDGLHGLGAWDANPWVAAYTFTVQRGNIDEVKV